MIGIIDRYGRIDTSSYKLYDDGVPKHRKRKKRTVKKSDHKHIYDLKVIVKYKIDCFDKYMYHYMEVCSICGKEGEVRLFDLEKEDGYYRLIAGEEVLDKYKGFHIVGR